ncbi:hypothetical protein HER10_EVM0003137 [Colletotrichum scovillei]|uniref:uncharacterized protein n=1 Tax=Colletotrichum scovillei TaxID=1209932 RepID=UPI0015C3E227|nr:uncharacterized protein HER10_EVM0003137 [Colletotrichum scovillei]KAF4784024.1 hypothetical protein HER10_EVM0003137 [Colletotrichum scovillei]
MPPSATSIEERQPVLLPCGGWDTHHHIFEPESFPYSPNRHLTPPLGITRSVLTHGLSYGNDCTSLKAFVPRLGSQKTRAVGVIDPETTTDEELLAMHRAGVRGLRVNLYQYKAMEDVELQKSIAPWSLTMTTTRTEFWTTLEPFVRDVIVSQGVILVTDHFALLKATSLLPGEHREDPTTQPGYDAVMRLVRDGHLWVKLSAPYRISDEDPGYSDVKFLVRAFVDANKRVLWGSDWPHTPRMKTPYLEVDDAAWLKSLRSWLSDEEWDLLMVQNPSHIFGR